MSNTDVKVIHRKNTLKQKVCRPEDMNSKGYVDPEHVINAQMVIENGVDDYNEEIEKSLHLLFEQWKKLQTIKDDKDLYTTTLDSIHRYTNHIKDLAGVYNFKLMNYFAQSLRDFSEHIDTQEEAHLKIVQAHLDVMTIAFKENVIDSESDQAKELKTIVMQAIQKYS